MSREAYCAVCGCLLSLPAIRDPVNPEPDEDPMIVYFDPYDARILPKSSIQWLEKFRVVGCWAESDLKLVNLSSKPGLFVSPPALFQEWEPEVNTVEGKMEQLGVFGLIDDNANGMLFPIHQACLDIMERMSQVRQRQQENPKSARPNSLADFCHGLRYQMRRNVGEREGKHHYYGMMGGMEWPHEYYGARQFWGDGWENEPGWEFLCADPSSLEIPDLASYLRNELSKSPSFSSEKDIIPMDQLSDHLPWLFPEEVRCLLNDTGQMVDKDGIRSLITKADLISADEGGLDEEKKKLAAVPVALKNRWRIWKILDGITLPE